MAKNCPLCERENPSSAKFHILHNNLKKSTYSNLMKSIEYYEYTMP